ncbi:MAG: L-tyrosine/L-tryptophan isonitrile synthase family protein [Bacteriovoracaceae bacterium]
MTSLAISNSSALLTQTILIELLAFHPEGHKEIDLGSLPLYNKIFQYVERGEKLQFILPAFPAKSSNREKTIGILPDLGEFLGLTRLQNLCQKIQRIYEPGAEVLICSDGRVFNDLVLVPDEDLMQYQSAIKAMIADHQFNHLKTFSLDECFGDISFEAMRVKFMRLFGEELDILKQRVGKDPHELSLFNGIHRFITEDRLALIPDKSKNQISKESKLVTFQVMNRSKAWDRLLLSFFPEALRLSIHPYPVKHHKFGLKLVDSNSSWATPWHNAVLKTNEGFTLVKNKEAKSKGILRHHLGLYAYYDQTYS